MLRRPKHAGRIMLGLLALVLAIPFGWYVVERLRSSGRAIRLRENENSKPADFEQRDFGLIVGTFNIAHGRGLAESNWHGDAKERETRLGQIARLFAKDKLLGVDLRKDPGAGQDLDLVILNEVDFDATWSGHVNQAEFLAKRAGFPYWIEQRNLDVDFPFFRLQCGNAILSKYPLSDPQLIDLPAYSSLEPMFAGKKQAVICTMQLDGSRKIRVLAVHLEHRSEDVRVAAAKVIDEIRRQSDLPLLVAGDFNSSPVTFPGAEQDEHGQTALSLLLDSDGFQTRPREPEANRRTFPADHPNLAIDWVLAPKSWTWASEFVPAVMLSDHRPMLAHLAIGPPPPPAAAGSKTTRERVAKETPKQEQTTAAEENSKSTKPSENIPHSKSPPNETDP